MPNPKTKKWFDAEVVTIKNSFNEYECIFTDDNGDTDIFFFANNGRKDKQVRI